MLLPRSPTTSCSSSRTSTDLEAYRALSSALDLVKAVQAGILRGDVSSALADSVAEARAALDNADDLALRLARNERTATLAAIAGKGAK